MACGAYTSDLTGSQTYSQSHYFSPHTAANLFDNSDATQWYVQNPTATEWFQVQFSEAKSIAKLRLKAPGSGFVIYAIDQLILKASNTGAFGGEETTLLTTASGLSWSGDEWKEWEFDNESEYAYYRATVYRKSESWLQHVECEMMACNETLASSDDTAGIGDSSDSFSLTDGISDVAGIGDSADAYNTDSPTSDVLGVADSADASGEWSVSDSDVSGFNDSSDGFNWTAWFTANRDRAVVRYYCKLTGDPDGLSDLTIPISSFQATKRTGESTFLSVSVPGMSLAGDIADRSNGEIVIDMAYLLDGVESLREEILRVELEQINPQEGARSRTITLSGHKTTTYDARAVSIQGANYKYTSDGSLGFRFPQADPYLNPGDALTVIDTDDVFTVDYITYAISARGAKFMEVREG